MSRIRSMNQHEVADRSNYISPAGDMDSKRNPQRRRVPVACGRCRRRKIKCSGDSGDGQGCSNCRSAGNTDCQFLRVNSSAVLPKGTGWPYPNAGGVAASPRMRVYSPHLPGKSTLLSMGSPQTRMSGFQRTSDFDLGTDVQGFPRPVGLDSMHYETEQGSSYNQSPAYILPNGPSGMVDYEASSWSPKIWEPMFNVNRSANGGIYSDTETNGSMAQSPYSYMLPSQGILSHEIPQTAAAAMNMVSVSEGPGSDRTLPTPTIRPQQVSGNTSSIKAFPEGMPGLSVPSDYKGSFWNQRCTDPNQRIHHVPSNASFPSSPTQSTKCNSDNSKNAVPELVFSYLPLSSSTTEVSSPSLSSAAPASSTTSSSNTSYAGLSMETSLDTPSQDYRTLPSDTRLARSFSRDESTSSQRLLVLSNECSPDIYSYSSTEKSSKARPDESGCSATLISGLPYTRVQYADPPNNMFPCGMLPDNIQEYNHRGVVGNMHRTPVSPLGNQGAY
ncbi:hypothetical protein N7533_003437 [Penicillium manginii]|uniref:uncharacterized protein n=1 Tax=Penicillium manginii TaxID=203109 RepID=UPI00254851C2|nr:uncharacterized protein N7533_003437 [Penicillium manginii]KAJ5761398.1 hypothetical protein N7533_003437 [Penicillium manginii]